jgi:general secretion pathway protein M
MRYPSIAVLGYVVAVAALVTIAGTSLADLYDRHVAVRSATELLKQLEARNAANRGSSPDNPGPEGSPLIEGQTVTVAGAALLQRVAGAVTRAGGNVLSSQVDVSGTAAKQNFVSLLASCELDQPALGPLLYDIEAGMPFLFVDQLVVQAPASGRDERRRLRVMLGVSGQWQGSRR